MKNDNCEYCQATPTYKLRKEKEKKKDSVVDSSSVLALVDEGLDQSSL